ncbi:MAG: cysteine desulfurase-like protein [Rhodothermales bacterium]|nr:cysteine desulfurase-like protein [Rhodothermales bacterium]
MDVSHIRSQFPALAIRDQGRPRVYLDNPGGTQVAQQVIDRTVSYLTRTNANGGGAFVTSVESDALLDEAHAAMADLLGAASPNEIVFGQNMTTLTFHMSRTLGQQFEAGQEIIVTRMDHDANVSPWLLLARDLGMTIRWMPFDTTTFRYDLDAFQELLSEKTALVALNYASNALGTINPVAKMCAMAREAGALTYVDAVQYVPHAPTDVQALGCDFLACSAYKFFGPHQGILWGRESLLASLPPYKVRPADEALPIRHETGTLSHEGMAGTLGAVEYLASLGTGATRREQLISAMSAFADYEQTLCRRLIDGLKSIDGVTVYGLTGEGEMHERVPTVIIDIEGVSARTAAEHLAAENIFVWDGDYYAMEVINSLGFGDRGGLLRIGLAHYNTAQEVDLVCSAVAALSSEPAFSAR